MAAGAESPARAVMEGVSKWGTFACRRMQLALMCGRLLYVPRSHSVTSCHNISAETKAGKRERLGLFPVPDTLG